MHGKINDTMSKPMLWMRLKKNYAKFYYLAWISRLNLILFTVGKKVR